MPAMATAVTFSVVPSAVEYPAEFAIPPAEIDISRWLRLMRAEYVEIPGLSLTEPQVRRLWGLDTLMATALLSALLDVGFLRRTGRGTYVRADQG